MITYEAKGPDSMKNRLKRLRDKAPYAFTRAVEQAAAEFMDWATVGSPRESSKAPLDTGDLRLNVYVRVGNKKIKYQQKGKVRASRG